MAVYKGMSEGSMFLTITINNIRVSLLAFAAGVLFSVGTGYILFRNGIMLGAFHYLFFEHGYFDDTILTIWIHGTLEITAIIIAGAAGLIMGNGLLFPGTYPRAYAFRKETRVKDCGKPDPVFHSSRIFRIFHHKTYGMATSC